jgi:hypothetical protein
MGGSWQVYLSSAKNPMKREFTYIISGQHFYQPLRKASLPELADTQASPDGIDWTQRISQECYLPRIMAGTLEYAAFDMYGTLRAEFNLSQEQAQKLKTAMAERG